MLQHDSVSILADEASAGSIVVSTGVTGTFILFFNQALSRMLPYLIISLFVILLDLSFGIKAAKVRGEEVRISRAIRRTLGKMVEYFCWSVLASTIAVATNLPIIETGLMLVVIGIEMISIFQNWFTVKRGKTVSVDLPKVIENVISEKTGIDIHGAIKVEEDTVKESCDQWNDDKGEADGKY